jgi:glycosyltransferase involved in cell wall biosynthesis
MMRICFVVPAHGRAKLAAVCLRRLVEVCEELSAAAVVVACDENADIAKRLGLRLIRQDNRYLGRRFNDGFQFAAKHAEYVMPLGSDDLVTTSYVRTMLAAHDGDSSTVGCARLMAAVAPDGSELARLRIPYEGGAGPRLFPSSLLARVGGRPADETRQRAIDGSVRARLEAKGRLRFVYAPTGPLDLVDIKTAGENLNTYEMLLPYATARHLNPWEQLATVHPPATVAALEGLFR